MTPVNEVLPFAASGAATSISAAGVVRKRLDVRGVNGHTVLIQESLNLGADWTTVQTITANGITDNFNSDKETPLIRANTSVAGTGSVTIRLIGLHAKI